MKLETQRVFLWLINPMPSFDLFRIEIEEICVQAKEGSTKENYLNYIDDAPLISLKNLQIGKSCIS